MAYIGNVPAEKYTALTQQTFSSPTGTSFTLSQAVTNSVDIDLYIDNVKQNPASYSVSGTALTTSTISSPSTMYCIFNGRTTETVNPPDDSVGLSQIASGTDGNLITFDASGNPAYVATGNDGQVLTSAGAGQPCAFETPAAGGSLTLISSVTASGSASVNFTSGITSTYDTYVVYGEGIVPAEDDRELYIRTSTDGGSSFDNSSGNYNWIINEYETGSYAGSNSASDASGRMVVAGIGNASGESINFKMYIHAPSNAALQTFMDGEVVFMRATGVMRHNRFGVRRISAADVDAIQFIMGSGNITSGRFSLFGIAHA